MTTGRLVDEHGGDDHEQEYEKGGLGGDVTKLASQIDMAAAKSENSRSVVSPPIWRRSVAVAVVQSQQNADGEVDGRDASESVAHETHSTSVFGLGGDIEEKARL